MGDWSELPEDILDEIVNRLTGVEDVVRCRTVCKPWRSVLLQKNQCFDPVVMHAEREGRRCFIGKKKFWLELPEAQGRRWWGTQYGWVVTVGLDLNIHLLNPLSRIQIPLPSQPNLYRSLGYISYKFCLSSNLSSVVAIFGGWRELAFASLGDKSWTPIESPPELNNEDVTFFDGKFYAVSSGGTLRVCQINTNNPKAIDIASPPDFVHGKCYLVQVSKDLILVARKIFEVGYRRHVDLDQYHYYETKSFAVFKFDFPTKKWSERIHDFGDYAVFVGNNSSFAISTSIYSELKSNCIYFTDDNFLVYENNFCDMGVFDLKKGSLTFHDFHADVFSEISRPIFFRPSL